MYLVNFHVMFTAILLAFVALTQAQAKDPAPEITDNPAGAAFSATLQKDKPVRGSITGVSAEAGKGITFSIDFHDFPVELGPFAYHIHVNPVPEDGNCTAAGGHLDPHNVTDAFKCDPALPQDCQVGDLSGKHGKITVSSSAVTAPENVTDVGGSYMVTYDDWFVSSRPDSNAFLGNGSVVVHASNGTRLNCGSFQVGAMVGGANGTEAPGSNATYTSGAPKPSATTTATSSAKPSSGSASTSAPGSTASNAGSGFKHGAEGLLVGMGVVAVIMMPLY